MSRDAPRPARVLIIAGSDSSAGAGIQADLKTVHALGGYAQTAITALTAQNTQGVTAVEPVPPAFVAQQIAACLNDIGADAIKTGMLHSAAVIDAVAQALRESTVPLIVDPVMIAKGGAPLLRDDAVDALRAGLIARASVLTPNLPEAAALLGRSIPAGITHLRAAADALLALGPQAVLLKGGHADGPLLHDVLVTRGGESLTLTANRQDSRHTHGTGCSMASAIATGLAQGLRLPDAVRRAHGYIQDAIARAPQLGHGHGPLGHFA